MAFTGQAFLQGRSRWMIAPKGHALAHWPQDLHFAGSMRILVSPGAMASKRQAFRQALPRQNRQMSETEYSWMGQSSQAAGITATTLLVGCWGSGLWPMARRMRPRRISRSLYTQQRYWGLGPGLTR